MFLNTMGKRQLGIDPKLRKECKDCKHRKLIALPEDINYVRFPYKCTEYRRYLTADNKQFTIWDNRGLCNFQPKENKA